MATTLMARSIACLFSVRKRAWHPSNQGPSPDNVESAFHVKLYVAHFSRIATEEVICPLFEQYGSITEVVILRDKRTGQQQGGCFMKYATLDEADRAIKALNNQHYFLGEVLPITVKYADWELERLGNFLMPKEFLMEPFLDCKPET